jgi:hypothetical protein
VGMEHPHSQERTPWYQAHAGLDAVIVNARDHLQGNGVLAGLHVVHLRRQVEDQQGLALPPTLVPKRWVPGKGKGGEEDINQLKTPRRPSLTSPRLNVQSECLLPHLVSEGSSKPGQPQLTAFSKLPLSTVSHSALLRPQAAHSLFPSFSLTHIQFFSESHSAMPSKIPPFLLHYLGLDPVLPAPGTQAVTTASSWAPCSCQSPSAHSKVSQPQHYWHFTLFGAVTVHLAHCRMFPASLASTHQRPESSTPTICDTLKTGDTLFPRGNSAQPKNCGLISTVTPVILLEPNSGCVP